MPYQDPHLKQSLSGGIYNPGPSKQEVQAAQQRAFLRTPLRGNRHVAVVSMAGGVGKTITAGFLGQAWGEARGDRVCAIDANPDAGNLAERFAGQATVGADGRPVRALLTVRDLLTDDAIAPVDSVADLSNYMTIAGRLHILPAPTSVDDVLSAQEYRRAQAIADRFYNLTIIDTGTSIAHETHRAILELADDLVFVVGPSMDAARRVKAMMDDLQARGYGDLLARATVMVITRSSAESSLARSRRGGGVDPATLASYFARRVRDVVRVPYSRGLSDGMAADFAQLSEDIRAPYLQAAAGIAAHFNGPKTPAPILSRQRVPRVTSAQAVRGRRWPGLGARTKAGEPLPPATMKVTTSSGQDIQDLNQLDELDTLPRYGRREEYLNDRRD
ncbi:MinD/ParA family ATP-binding protein [Kineococcus rhizosphaerae]|uniref:MinD-like ATPase involved in chromosome partitioning or flagellar assembly n=1 Tax=Kineococcus rhizosphaerae TaxID=559628 RepID=A0A2T0QQ64_9ACTN|nr:hypothetical protein [Kineococcus rhizosphaerae]PRY06796.1 MinD-like ATPase involved in chromosome partitioning or flagellar assembly [Kineococcus rhizosphaerae]